MILGAWLEKTALVTDRDTAAGTQVTNDWDHFVSKLQPGDILISKPNAGDQGISAQLTRATQVFQWANGDHEPPADVPPQLLFQGQRSTGA